LSWKYENGQLSYQDDSVEVTLKGDIQPNKFSKNYALDPYFIYEWKKYRVIVGAKEKSQFRFKNVNVFFGDSRADHDPDGDFWEYTFKNYIGKSEIKIYLGDRLLPPLYVEVISTKLTLNEGDALFYPKFYRKLVEGLEDYQIMLSFEITSPTYIAVEDVLVPPNLLILYHQILEIHEIILEGIRTILMKPHKDLTVKEDYVDLHEAETVNPDVCLSIFHNPNLLVKPKSSSIPLCSKLKGYVPRKLLQFRNIETFNTSENRFVKQFIKELLHHIVQIEETYAGKLGERLKTLRELKENLEMALLTECFQTVDESNLPSTFASQVLLKKDGYREILQAHNKLLLSKSPIFTYLQEKINQRNIAEMYEFWCFFELSKKLANFIKIKPKQFKVNVETTLEGGLAQSRVKSIIGDYELIYNKKFMRSKKGSYSVPLKPDFSLQKDGNILIIFDAKFRFDIKDQELEVTPAEDTQEDAIQKIEMERMANISDIFKMHTYRDALNAKSAVILYPGNKNMFFSKRNFQKTENDFKKIFEKICRFEEGVGYLAFLPE